MTDTELILKIINAVKQRDCLWNVHSSEYAKRDKLEKAWQEVADDVGRPDVFCREKWRNVRTGFLRSIQYNNNARTDNGDNTEDVPTPRRKRFYLYDEMKFLLPSTETIGQTKKRRKLSRGTKPRTSNDEPSGEYVDTVSTIQTYAANEDTKLNSNEGIQGTNANYPELLNELQLTPSTPKPLMMKMNQSPPLQIEEAKGEQNVHSTPIVVPNVATKCEVENNTTIAASFNATAKRNECDGRDEQQLLAFFRGNIDDILSLPRHKQRLFKRRMLELIDDLHRPDNSVSTRRYC